MRHLLLVLATLFAASGCAPRAVIAVDMPAELTVPADVRSLALVDRKGSAASAAARLALQEELQGTARFTVTEPTAAQSALGKVRGTVGAPLDAEAVGLLRGATGADGVLAIDQVEQVETWSYVDRVESQTRTETRRDPNCPSCPGTVSEVTTDVPVTEATCTLTLTVGYQLYGASGAVVDAWTETLTDSRSATGTSADDARRAVGDTSTLATELAQASAFEATRHIAPWATTVSRRWFAGGGPEVAEGAKLARAGDWVGAEKAWKKGKKTTEGDTKGRVAFNLAVAAERRGDIASALTLCKEAKGLLKNADPADTYLVDLRARKRQATTLAAQMAPAPAEE
jgi:hypothetical protein